MEKNSSLRSRRLLLRPALSHLKNIPRSSILIQPSNNLKNKFITPNSQSPTQTNDSVSIEQHSMNKKSKFYFRKNSNEISLNSEKYSPSPSKTSIPNFHILIQSTKKNEEKKFFYNNINQNFKKQQGRRARRKRSKILNFKEVKSQDYA